MTDTKTCTLYEDEIQALIQYHARQIANSGELDEEYLERINYLNKRLKAEKKDKTETAPIEEPKPKGDGW